MKTKLAVMGLLLFTSCTSLNHLQKTPVNTSSFNGALAQGYRTLAEREQRASNYGSIENKNLSEHYAKKGLDAASNKMVMPDETSQWSTNDSAKPELAAARNRLLNVLNGNVKFVYPTMTAEAQVNYDCWIAEQAESFDKVKYSGCRDKFATLISRLEDENPLYPAQYVHIPYYDHQDVFFKLGSVKIDHEDSKVIKYMADLARRVGGQKVVVKGYADASGNSEAYNINISKARAEAVANHLVSYGVPADRIFVYYYGSTYLPATELQKSRPEKYERRVEIELVR
jgi:outer membrane protein OmpA-like peptidoglycan-associated protein